MKVPIQAVKATVGGLAVMLGPQEFMQLVTQERLTTIHGQIRKPKGHSYLTINNGITFYTKTEEALPRLRADIEAADMAASEKLYPAIARLELEMVTVGGLAVGLKPQDFVQLVTKKPGTSIHGQLGRFRRWHLYLTVSGGITFYTKTKKPLPRLHADIKAVKLKSGINL